MKKFVSFVGEKFMSINSDDENHNSFITGIGVHYPIIACVGNVVLGEHVEFITFGDKGSDFSGIKTDAVNLGIVAGYTNIELDKDLGIDNAMSAVFDYIINNLSEDDEIYVDITYGNRYAKFAIGFAARYLNEFKKIKCTVVKCKDDTNIVNDITNDYIMYNMMTPIVDFLVREGNICSTMEE